MKIRANGWHLWAHHSLRHLAPVILTTRNTVPNQDKADVILGA